MNHLIHDERGQMAVEMAVVLPVLLVAMVIVLDCIHYAGQCARFDHLASQAVLAQASSPAGESPDIGTLSAAVQSALAEQMGEGCAVEVSASRSGDGFWKTNTFTCVMNIAPWPFSSSGFSLMGVRIPTSLSHDCSFAVETYVVGGSQ